MLIKFGAKNFCCFREGVEITFELNSNCPRHISHGKNVSNVLGVRGANASGKTNLLKILAAINYITCNSFTDLKLNDKILFINGFFYQNTEPIEFFIEFKIGTQKFTYEISIKDGFIFTEKLIRKRSRETPVFEREYNKIVKCVGDYKELEIIKLRSNASFICTANQYDIDIIKPIYQYFDAIVSNVDIIGFQDNWQPIWKDIEALYYHDNEQFSFVKKYIKEFDTGIDDIKISLEKEKDGTEKFYTTFYHLINNKSNVKLPYFHESKGTLELFKNLGFYYNVLSAGGVLVLDEFDNYLHPHIIPKLIELFTNEETNPHNAQLIFTSHYDNVMDILGKYRTVLVNKEDNESFAYRLDEIPGDVLRNDRPISPVYNSKLIGGVPRI